MTMRMDGSPFFSGRALPVCAFTRAEIDRMYKRHPTTPAAEQEPIHLSAPTRDCKILSVAATMFGISVRELVGPGREAILVLAREYAATRLRYELGRSYPQIGAVLRRDHATVINLLRPRGGRWR